MSGQLAKWLLYNSVAIDEIGRILIKDQEVISEINGAVSSLAQDIPDGNMGCGGGCDTSCGG